MVDLMDRLNTVLKSVPARTGLPHVKYVDLRGTLSSRLGGNRYKDWWANELHPTQAGYRAVAAKFNDAIRPFPIP
jgi:lysophospholipase L1-like esterase